ncbi:spermidine synthase [Sulfurimonas sp.]|uniref:spermine/spermidine synthase domain-containing protein n=1 Tax=Sulfurimonas sp. TaxID=2022749 RepID=UPI0035642186
MKEFIYNEMMVHVPLCTHKEPKRILIISNDAAGLEKEVEKHTNITLDKIECSLDNVSKLEDSKYDVIISEMEGDSLFISQINRVLSEDGILVIKHPNLDKIEENKSIMQTLGNYFKIIMPYNLGNGETALLCSHTYHPTADLILQRTDMLDGLEYYNCDIHPAAFAMGNNVRKTYLGIIKN